MNIINLTRKDVVFNGKTYSKGSFLAKFEDNQLLVELTLPNGQNKDVLYPFSSNITYLVNEDVYDNVKSNRKNNFVKG